MKKTIRIIVSLILCAAVVFSLGLPALAKEEKTAYVIVSGMNTFPLYDSEGNKVWPRSTGTILSLVRVVYLHYLIVLIIIKQHS